MPRGILEHYKVNLKFIILIKFRVQFNRIRYFVTHKVC